MLGKCKRCGFQEGFVGIKNGLCRKCYQGINEGLFDETSLVDSNNNKTLFSFNGRMSKKTFVAFSMAFCFCNSLLVFLFSAIYKNIGIGPVIVFTALYAIPACWVALACWVKRFHDLNQSAWNAISIFIPYMNLVALLYLCFASEKNEQNKYGDTSW